MSSDTPRTNAAVVSKAYIDREMDYYKHKFVLADVARQLERENAELRQQLETERMRLAACSTAALGYFTDCLPEYRSASLEDVLRLRQQLVERDALIDELRRMAKEG